jgi:homoserine acetyltransferase
MDWLKEARAATYTVPDFNFAEGGTLDVRLHYRTLGALAPAHHNAVLIQHGAAGAPATRCQQVLHPHAGCWADSSAPPSRSVGGHAVTFPAGPKSRGH